MDIYRFDGSFREKGFEIIAGIDEAGRGPIAGPVVASAVILSAETCFEGLDDSKVVPEKRRQRLFFEILASAISVGVGISGVDDIHKLNILGATKLAMKMAVEQLEPHPGLLLLDAVTLPDVHMEQSSHIKGDSKSASIAAASIVAKYVRDRLMLYYHREFPEYGFDRHKGYGTREHMDLVRKYGPCPQHRMGFKGVCDSQRLF
ncbi:ribonuclease HII [Nitrospirota bacterium]